MRGDGESVEEAENRFIRVFVQKSSAFEEIRYTSSSSSGSPPC